MKFKKWDYETQKKIRSILYDTETHKSILLGHFENKKKFDYIIYELAYHNHLFAMGEMAYDTLYDSVLDFFLDRQQ